MCMFLHFTQGKNSKPKAHCRIPDDDNDIQRFVVRICVFYSLKSTSHRRQIIMVTFNFH